MSRTLPLLTLTAALALTAPLSACSRTMTLPGMTDQAARSLGMGTDGQPVAVVTSTDSTCSPDVQSFRDGINWIQLKNSRATPSTLKIEGGGSNIEVAAVAPGQTMAVKLQLKRGDVKLTCAGARTVEVTIPVA